jgi:hypothetical protein
MVAICTTCINKIKLLVLLKECVYVFPMNIKINIDYLRKKTSIDWSL